MASLTFSPFLLSLASPWHQSISRRPPSQLGNIHFHRPSIQSLPTFLLSHSLPCSLTSIGIHFTADNMSTRTHSLDNEHVVATHIRHPPYQHSSTNQVTIMPWRLAAIPLPVLVLAAISPSSCGGTGCGSTGVLGFVPPS